MNIFKACAGEVVRGVKAVGRIERILAPDNQKRPKPPRRKGNGTVKEAPSRPAEGTTDALDPPVACPYKVDK